MGSGLGGSGPGGTIGSHGNYGGNSLAGPAGTGRLSFPGTRMGLDMHRIPIIGNMFPNPADEFKQQQMQEAAQAYSMYRPEQMQAYMNAMNAQSASLQPMNNALAAMYGPGATQGFEATNPYGPTAFYRGAAAGTEPFMPWRGFGGGPPPANGAPPPMRPEDTPPNNLAMTEPGTSQYAMYEPWRMGMASQAGTNNQKMANQTGGNYGAGGPGLKFKV